MWHRNSEGELTPRDGLSRVLMVNQPTGEVPLSVSAERCRFVEAVDRHW